MIRALLVVAMLAGCGGSAATVAPTVVATAETPRSETMCVAFDRVEREIEPALNDTADPLSAAMAGLTVVITGSDIEEMAESEEGQVAADLIELGEAFQHQGSVIQATSANPDLPADDPTAGTDLYAVLRSRYEC